MQFRTVCLATAIVFAATNAHARKTERLSTPVAMTGATLVVAGGVVLVVGTIGFMGDLGVRIGKAWNNAWCWNNNCRQTHFDNTPRDVFGAMALVGLGTAIVGGVMYLTASSRVRVTPTASGVLVEGTF